MENAQDLANLGKVSSGKDGDNNKTKDQSKEKQTDQNEDKRKDAAGKVLKKNHEKDDDGKDDDEDLEGMNGGDVNDNDKDDNDDDDKDKDKKKTRMSLEKGEVMDAPQQLAQYYMMVTNHSPCPPCSHPSLPLSPHPHYHPHPLLPLSPSSIPYPSSLKTTFR